MKSASMNATTGVGQMQSRLHGELNGNFRYVLTFDIFLANGHVDL